MSKPVPRTAYLDRRAALGDSRHALVSTRRPAGVGGAAWPFGGRSRQGRVRR
ncbi:hypothetical protein [Streptosporangium sp. NPDC051022]|uniref:hypothetical protein n=1 Tax=Streptosporangium sp. NPDC051022 TaxID=3155752 RepID=UPI003433A7DF